MHGLTKRLSEDDDSDEDDANDNDDDDQGTDFRNFVRFFLPKFVLRFSQVFFNSARYDFLRFS